MCVHVLVYMIPTDPFKSANLQILCCWRMTIDTFFRLLNCERAGWDISHHLLHTFDLSEASQAFEGINEVELPFK